MRMPRGFVLPVLAAACLLSARPAAAQVRIIDNPRPGGGPRVGRGVIDENPRKEIETARRRGQAFIEEARKLTDEGKCAQAAIKLDDASVLLVDAELAAAWKAVAIDLSLIGMKQLEAANAAYEAKDYKKALAEYNRIAVVFTKLPPSTVAYKMIRAAEGDPQLKAFQNEARATAMFALVEEMVAVSRRVPPRGEPVEPTAAPTTAPTTAPASPLPPPEGGGERPPAAAPPVPAAAPPVPAAVAPVQAADIMAMNDDRFVRAVETLENIIAACPGAETTNRAARLLNEMEADTACAARLSKLRQERAVKALLGKANAYRDAGLLKKAAPIYRELMDKHPDSPLAATAAEELGKIEAKVGEAPKP